MSEVERCIQILCRRTKNNPLLVGDPGVGKTAIAEGLARKIVSKQVPEVLAKSTIFSLDMGALLAGTRYRLGEYNFASDFHSQPFPTLVPVRHFSAGAPRTVFFSIALNYGGNQ